MKRPYEYIADKAGFLVTRHSGRIPRMTPLSTDTLLAATHELAAQDADLARVVDRYGPPPLWGRKPGFATLIHIILEQQVSLASARAAMDRLLAAATPLTPERLLGFNDAEMKAIGFSRQKMGYARHLALEMIAGRFDFEALPSMDDDSVRTELIRLKGVGRWTSDIYLLMALLRPDVWPAGDLALLNAAQKVKGLAARPSAEEFEAMGEAWRPWRSVAARLLWWHYLDGKD
jgi:DNA-3-methyladenine glycosylase II